MFPTKKSRFNSYLKRLNDEKISDLKVLNCILFEKLFEDQKLLKEITEKVIYSRNINLMSKKENEMNYILKIVKNIVPKKDFEEITEYLFHVKFDKYMKLLEFHFEIDDLVLRSVDKKLFIGSFVKKDGKYFVVFWNNEYVYVDKDMKFESMKNCKSFL